MRVKHGFSVKNDDDDDVDDDDDDDHSVCDDYAGDGQLPWESNLQTRCGPGADQVETKQGWGPTWAHSLPGLRLVCAWSTSGPLGLHPLCGLHLSCACSKHALHMFKACFYESNSHNVLAMSCKLMNPIHKLNLRF